jgi:hypothetical protein
VSEGGEAVSNRADGGEKQTSAVSEQGMDVKNEKLQKYLDGDLPESSDGSEMTGNPYVMRSKTTKDDDGEA